MNSAIVKPMPGEDGPAEQVAVAHPARQDADPGLQRQPDTPAMPIVLPTHEATMIPRVTRECRATCSVSLSRRTPAFASPKAGTTRYADHGCTVRCSRSPAGTVARHRERRQSRTVG